jgi:UDP-GlcNAc:undecaprenyl-phosphate GlcNAc-1-phosphate transferase
MSYFLYFSLSAILALLITPLIKSLALKMQTLDVPTLERKIHKQPLPLLGGLAVFLAFALALAVYLWLGRPDLNIVPLKFFGAIIFGGLVLMAGGILDDKFNLPPKLLWLFPALSSAIIVWSGIGVGITQISNPFGSPIFIGYTLKLSAVSCQLSAVLAWAWMMGMIFTTKLLDGLDGLCSGVGLIGALTMFALSLTAKVNQPITAALAIIFAGSLLGFLFYNFHPASIFLGEAGSTLIGFMLGVLAIILGAKIATALLVMGIPILDVAWAIVRRIFYRRSPFVGDRAHLHYRLLDVGLSHRQTVLVLWAISAIFGFTAVFLQSMGKLIALLLLFCVMLILAISVVILYKRQHPHIPDLFDSIPNKKRVDETQKFT